jgi:hypothetical protein
MQLHETKQSTQDTLNTQKFLVDGVFYLGRLAFVGSAFSAVSAFKVVR